MPASRIRRLAKSGLGSPSIRFTTCGCTSTPPFAIAEYMAAICIGVTAMPWPIGMLPIDESYHLSGGSRMPGASPGRSTPVVWPKPKRSIHFESSDLPTILAIVTVPTLDDSCRICRTVKSLEPARHVVVHDLVADLDLSTAGC